MKGQAHGAVSILNATATGRGCALAITTGLESKWVWGGEDLQWQGTTDDRLARSCLHLAQKHLEQDEGALVTTSSTFPPSRGLKTSSAAATAMLRAAGVDDVELLAVQASRAAGVTLTGAYDDQVAVTRGGCHLTDNARLNIIAELDAPDYHVAVWVPHDAIAKSQLAGLDASQVAPAIGRAEAMLRSGDIAKAMTANGRAFTALYQAAGLPVRSEPTATALQHGALGAGLSGTGPAVAALFDDKTDLPHVAGGQWHWSRVAP